jgi:membrane associated rhomboid family serine protease
MLLIPIGDEPNDPKRVPWMNYTLIAANVLVFVAVRFTAPTQAAFEKAVLDWGYIPAVGEPHTVLSAMFMHAGWLHLFGNMLFLWIFGDNIERRLGPLGYLLAYLAVGIGATLIYGRFSMDSTVPCVGASGAISGVEGLYFVACPRHRVKLFFWFYFFINVFTVPARLVIGLWFVLQDLVPVLIQQSPTGYGVAHMAHLGGFASGLVLMILLLPIARRNELEEAGELSRSHRYKSGQVARYDRERNRSRSGRYDSNSDGGSARE